MTNCRTAHIAVNGWIGGRMSDLIYRQFAIDSLLSLDSTATDEMVYIDAVLDMLKNIPEAEPELKKAKDICNTVKDHITVNLSVRYVAMK